MHKCLTCHRPGPLPCDCVRDAAREACHRAALALARRDLDTAARHLRDAEILLSAGGEDPVVAVVPDRATGS